MAEIRISGVVKSATGVTLENADVLVYTAITSTEPVVATNTDKDGNYEMVLPDTTIQFWIAFATPNYSGLKFPIILFADESYVIDANISPLYFANLSDSIFIIGDFNNFDMSKNAIAMTKLENGIYSAKIPNAKILLDIKY